jgi:multidrug resistance protein, MATE family
MRKELSDVFKLSFPLIASNLSSSIMLFSDRLMLMNYSLKTFNSVAAVISIYNLIAFSGGAIISVSEVFVGEYNGQKKYHMCAKVAWQMIWLSLFVVPFIFFLKGWIGRNAIPLAFHAEGIGYFNIVILCIPIQYLVVSLASFFVGVQKIRIIVISTIISSIINIVLDFVLIFGHGPIPALGGKGAALGTLIALSTNFFILLIYFLSKKYRSKFHSNEIVFLFSIIRRCWNVGLPSAIGLILEIGAIYAAFIILSTIDNVYVTILASGQILVGTLACVTDGMKKGIISISSNAIGSKNYSLIANSLRAHVQIFIVTIIVLFSLLLIFFDKISFLFASNLDQLNVNSFKFSASIFRAGLWVFCFLLLDGVSWIISGILISLKDTKFIMYVSSINIWLTFVLSLYVIVKLQLLPEYIWLGASTYALVLLVIFYSRYTYFKRKSFNTN